MAQPLVQPFWAQDKIVRTKSIPNVDIDRLRDSLSALHWALHTPEGIRAQDIGHGKIHADYGRKALAIRDELKRRGDPGIIGCRWCEAEPGGHAAR